MIFLSIQNFAINLLRFVFWIQEAKEAWSAYDQHNKAQGDPLMPLDQIKEMRYFFP